MRKNIKKIVAGILSATMLLSTSAIAFADNLTSGGTNSNASKVEGFVDTDVFSVVVPTSVAADTFKFIVDPQQLIYKTNADAYQGKTKADFESDATLFFLNSGGTYSHVSDKLEVVNKSAVAVNVNLSATITSAGDLTLASSGTFGESDTSAKIYLALKTDGGETEAITAQGATNDTLLSGAPDDAYDYLYSGGTYSYELTAAAKAANYTGFSGMKFYVEGVANPNGDFSEVTEAAPVLDIVWTVTPSASSVAVGNYWDDDINGWWIGANADPVNDGITTDATEITSAVMGGNDVKSVCSIDGTGEIWIKVLYSGAAQTAYEAGDKEITIVLNDGKTYTTTLE